MVYIIKDLYGKKRRLKAQGMADASIKECRQVKPDKDSWREKDNQLARKLGKRMQEEGVMHAFPSLMKKFCRDKNVT